MQPFGCIIPSGHEERRLSSHSRSDQAGDHRVDRVAGDDAERDRGAFRYLAAGRVEASADIGGMRACETGTEGT